MCAHLNEREKELLGSSDVQRGMATVASQHALHCGWDTLEGGREGGGGGGGLHHNHKYLCHNGASALKSRTTYMHSPGALT